MNRLILGAVASMLAFGSAVAQTPSSTTAPPPAGSSMGAPANPANPVPASLGDKAAASGQDNQAVATTDANADTPAKGANSFTMTQAKHRIAKKGYKQVKSLAKDPDGVWRGTAEKGGQPVNVWLDYKGNVGETSS